MSIQISDPLSLLPYQSGLVAPPLQEGLAQGQSNLDSRQRAIVLGDLVPIVFGRRIGTIGGVFVSPGATEGRFQNNGTTNELTVNLELVLSEGDLGQLELRDVFQRACRVGTWAQSYDRRAGTWLPGNFITAVAGTELWQCPFYCGTSGIYTNLTTLSYTNTHADGDDTWDKQVHAFVREGMRVTRILDSTLGSSNNLVDLALYLIRQSSRFPEALIDTAAMLEAATFTNANGFFYNGIFEKSVNLEDWLQQISSNFLLRISDKNGKKGFRPRVPVNNDGTIKTTAISWVFGFTEDHVLPNGFEIEYIPLSDRKAIAAQMLWRQQPENDIGIIRASEVRLAGTAANGPYEQYDLSEYCASENHAVKVGAYIIARRSYITHTLRIKVRPDAFNSTLVLGDIVRVRMQRETNVSDISLHDYLYEVERINKGVNGVVELDLIHFPIDNQGRSIVALAVNAAVGPGYVMPTGRTDFTCDIAGRDDDETPLADVGGNLPDLPDGTDFNYNVPAFSSSTPGDGIDNPVDPFEAELNPAITGTAAVGQTLTYNPGCAGAYIEWYLVNNTTGVRTLVEFGVAAPYIIGSSAIGKSVLGIGRCPDPGSADGYGTPIESIPTAVITNPLALICPGNSYTFSISWNLQGKSFLGNCNTGSKNGNASSGNITVVHSAANILNVQLTSELATNDCGGLHTGKPRTYTLRNGAPGPGSIIIWTLGASNGYSSDYWEGPAPVWSVACTNP